MLKTALQENYGKELSDKYTCCITGTKPDYEKMEEFMNEVYNSDVIKMLDRPDQDIKEPVLDKWWKVFHIPYSYSLNVDLNALYYTNNNIEKSQEIIR